MKHLLDIGASINVHMFHGGTNFGFHNGKNDLFNTEKSYRDDAFDNVDFYILRS